MTLLRVAFRAGRVEEEDKEEEDGSTRGGS